MLPAVGKQNRRRSTTNRGRTMWPLALRIILAAGAQPVIELEPAWYGYVLVRPARTKLGFFLSEIDQVADEVIISSDDIVVDVREKTGVHCSVYEVPESFHSIVSEVLVCGNQVRGVVRISPCTFSIEAEELPWFDSVEVKGRLFHLLLPRDQKALVDERCPKLKGKTIDISTIKKK